MDGDDGRFVVRVHRAGYQTSARIRSELLFLHSLRADGTVPAPVPHATPDGDFLLSIDGPNLDAPRDVSVLAWTPGRHINGRSTATSRKLGALTAQLHVFGSTWQRPADFERSSGQIGDLLAGAPTVPNLEAVPELDESTLAQLSEARRRCVTVAEALEAADGVFPLHADLHFGNVLIHNGVLHPIDFDDMAVAHALVDVAVSTALAKPESRGAYIDGYRSHRPFPDEWAEALPAFIVARQLLMVGWVSARAAELPWLRKWMPYTIARAQHCAEWMQSGDETWIEKFRALPKPD